jgi:hypothetical protein
LSPILGIVASQISGHLWPNNSFESIATQTVGAGGATSLTFNSIPNTYTHLQLRCLSRRDSGVSHVVILQFNGDTASNYWWHLLEGDGTSATYNTVSAATNRIQTFWPNPSSNLSNQFGAGVIDIHNYSSTTTNKTVKCLGGGTVVTAGKVNLTSGLWNSTSAINSITVSFLSDTVVENSKFALYGIKGA